MTKMKKSWIKGKTDEGEGELKKWGEERGRKSEYEKNGVREVKKKKIRKKKRKRVEGITK